jgi:hypothetical protein
MKSERYLLQKSQSPPESDGRNQHNTEEIPFNYSNKKTKEYMEYFGTKKWKEGITAAESLLQSLADKL